MEKKAEITKVTEKFPYRRNFPTEEFAEIAKAKTSYFFAVLATWPNGTSQVTDPTRWV